MNPGKQCTVSVIINCYNGSEFLRDTLDSVIGQTMRDMEIIFWDNRSTDDSSAIVKSYSDNRIQYFLADNHTTLGEGRNLAVKKARGKWIAFIDTDDIWLPTKLEKQINYCKINHISVAGTWVKTFGSNASAVWKYPTHPEHHAEIAARMLLNNPFVQSSILIGREVFDSDYLFNTEFDPAIDYDLFERLSHSYKTANVPEVLVRLRLHEKQASRTDSGSSNIASAAHRIRVRILKKMGILMDDTWSNFFSLIDYKVKPDFLNVRSAAAFFKTVADAAEKSDYPDEIRNMLKQKWREVVRIAFSNERHPYAMALLGFSYIAGHSLLADGIK